MKNLQLLFLSIVLFFLLSFHIFAQMFQCGTTTGESAEPMYIGTASHNVVVVYLDFADGLLENGDIARTDAELDQIGSIDAACFVGFDAEPLDFGGYTWVRRVNKYTYNDCWNRIFSDNFYLGSIHPDWVSHGSHGYPKSSGGDEGDTAKGYGSVRDYFKEVSYGKLTINPYGPGIINNTWTTQTGVKYIIPVHLPGIKSSYNLNSAPGLEAVMVIAKTQTNLQTGFDIQDFINNQNGKAIFIYAGGSPTDVGGATAGNSCILREKLTPNIGPGVVLGRCVIDGIAPTCHEYGHILGWMGHTVLGNYDLMNTGTDNQNCPSHPNMLYKLKAGWIDEDKVLKIRSNTSINSLMPSILANGLNEKRCAIITIYGEAGKYGNYKHSEQFIIENRRMIWNNPDIKFDKKLVWKHFPPPFQTPPGFNGGLLVYHYSPYNDLTNAQGGLVIIDKSIIVKSAARNLAPGYFNGDGDSRDFFGVTTSNPHPNEIITQLPIASTISSFILTTGLEFTGITQPAGTNLINCGINYTLGPPPQYDYVVMNEASEPNPYNLSGRIFINTITPQVTNVTHLQIQPGSIIDVPGLILSPKCIKAEGTASEPIVFRGCNYAQYNTGFKGLEFRELVILGNVNELSFTYCTFENLINGNNYAIKVLSSSFQPGYAPIRLENNIMNNSQNVLLNSSQSALMQINSIKNNVTDVWIGVTGTNATLVTGNIEIPAGNKVTFNPNSKFSFAEGSSVICSGNLIAEGNTSSRITFDKISTGDPWNGIYRSGGMTSMKYCDVNNSNDGLSLSLPQNGTIIDACRFKNNVNKDVSVNVYYDVSNINITNNEFTGTRNNCNLNLGRGNFINVYNNTFTGVDIKAISLINSIDPVIDRNNITGVPGGSGSVGIYSYSSGGTYKCNNIQNFSDGILLDNSSPVIFNNFLNSNVYGLFLTNGSNPLMSPAASDERTLIYAGYNTIVNSLNEEIYCNNNEELPLSLPRIQNGYNSIHDFTFAGCLINTNRTEPNILLAHKNYWGAGLHPNSSDFCPTGSVDYSNYLSSIPEPPSCNTAEDIITDNSSLPLDELLMGSANRDYYFGNYNSASVKYKDYLSLTTDQNKMYLPLNLLFYSTIMGNGNLLDLENYYLQLAQQFINDTLLSNAASNFSTKTDVEQTSFTEAISEYDNVINNSNNQPQVFYAYIDKMRVISLMLDSLLGNNGNGPQGGSQNSNINELEKTLSEFINFKIDNNSNSNNRSSQTGNSKFNSSNINGSKIKKAFNMEKVELRNKSINEIKSLIERSIDYKLLEYSFRNHISSDKIPDVNGDNRDKLVNNNLPLRFKLYQNYPNPFNPISKINYDIPKESQVAIKIFDILGREVARLVNEFKLPGYYSVSFDGTNYSSGVYFYRIDVRQAGSSTGLFSDVKKMVLIR